MQDIGGVSALCFSACRVESDKVLCPTLGNSRVDVGCWKGANEKSVAFILYDMTGRGFSATNHRDTRENGDIGMRPQKGLLNVEAILEEDECCAAAILWQGWSHEFFSSGCDVRDVFCAENDVVVRLEILFFEVRDSVAY